MSSSSTVGPISPEPRTNDEGGGGCSSLPPASNGLNHNKSPPKSLDLASEAAAAGGPDSLAILLITANVGSIFDDPQNLIPQWLTQVSHQIKAQECPAFVAIHCQEVYHLKNNIARQG
jgi:hypothetical protein